jgi:TonB-linked SusC/RagA family outer membrane protein
MKKHLQWNSFIHANRIKKLLLTMKIILVLMFAIVLQASASLYSQNAKLDLSVTDMKVKDVLKLIESKSNFRFFYNDELLELDKTLSLSANGGNINEVLKKIFANSNIAYKVFENNVVVIAPAASLQQQQITGTVSDGVNGEPLIGVNITIEGTTRGTITDAGGKFSIEVQSSNDVLIFTYVGYISERVTPGSQANVEVKLIPDIKSLEEVVVIGYGVVKKRDLTGAVGSVKTDDIAKSPTGNVMEAIQGKVSGVDIIRSSGSAGAGVNIRIRGNRSIGDPNNADKYNAANSPLFIIDGVQGGSFNDLNSNDIESVDFLKDVSSTAIYGYQGANGVVIITTKKAKAGKTKVSYSGYYGINGLTPYPAGRKGEDYIALRREAYIANGTYTNDESMFTPTDWNAIQEGQWVDWQDLLLNNGTLQNHQLSISGGNEKNKSYLSAGYYKEVGAVKDDFSRYNVRFNTDYTVAKWIKAGIEAQITYNKQNKRKDAFGKANSATPLGTPYDENGNIVIYPTGDNITLSPLTDFRPNAAIDNLITTRIFTLGYVELSPLKGLTYRSNLGVNLRYNREGIFNDSASMAQANLKYNDASITTDNSRNINWDNVITYNKEFGNHSFTITALTSYTKSIADNVYADGIKQQLTSTLFYKLDGTQSTSRTITSGYTESETMSYAGRLNYSFMGKYLLTGTFRTDGASQLASGHKWSSFPSIAAAWRISDENFMKSITPVSNLKLRLSYGEAGNSNIGAYGTQNSVVPANNMSFGEVSAPGYSFNYLLTSVDLTWERSASKDLGIDLGLLRNRIEATVDLYDTKTSGILLTRPLPVFAGGMVSGSSTFSIWQNIGTTENKGIEIGITSTNVKNKNFTWTTSFTFSKNKEKIVSLIDGKDIINTSDPEKSSLLLGHPIKSFYTYKKRGIWQISDSLEMQDLKTPFKPGDIKLADLNGDSIINATYDRQYIGSAVPDWVCGLQNTFSYKGIDLSIYLFARWGQMISDDLLGRYNPSGTGNGPEFIDYWTPENPTNSFPRPRQGAQLNSYTGYQTLAFVDGSYFKIKNITLGYTLPKSISRKVYIDNFRIYVTTSNILTLTKDKLLKNYDPENQGSEKAPMSKQIVFGVNIDF